MFYKRHFIFRFLGTLLFIGLLIAGGAAVFQAGQSQGYMQGIAASNTQLSAPVEGQPGLPRVMPGYYAGPYGFGRPHLFPFFGVGLALFFFFAIGGMFRMMAFRHWTHHASMEGRGPWGHVHHWGGDPAGKKPGPADASPSGETKA
jgi:hypothetical protein